MSTSWNGKGWPKGWKRLRKSILIRDNYLCVSCKAAGRIRPADEVDHIIPRHKDGSDEPDNLQSLCHDCHAEKTAREQGKNTIRQVGLDGYPI